MTLPIYLTMLLVEVLEGTQMFVTNPIGHGLGTEFNVAEHGDGARRVAQELLVLLLLRVLGRVLTVAASATCAATPAHAVHVIGTAATTTRGRLESSKQKHENNII